MIKLRDVVKCTVVVVNRLFFVGVRGSITLDIESELGLFGSVK